MDENLLRAYKLFYRLIQLKTTKELCSLGGIPHSKISGLVV